MIIAPGLTYYKKKADTEGDAEEEKGPETDQKPSESEADVDMKDQTPQKIKVLVKLYKKQQAKIDEAEN